MIEVTSTLQTNTDLSLTLCLLDLHYVQIHSQPQCTVIVCVHYMYIYLAPWLLYLRKLP